MNKDKQKEIPAKMNLIASDRKTLIYYIKYAWKTDFITRKLEVRELPEYRADLKVDEEVSVK